jgi:phosphoribosylamine--glycine ligase
MNVLVVGSGGREHALAWAVRRSPGAERVYIVPGNPGTAATGENIPLDPMDFTGIGSFCRERGVDLVVVGPDNPLAAGIADVLRDQGISVFGPGKAGARLESSKTFGMEFMRDHGVPCPSFAAFGAQDEALEHVRSTAGPWVIKADGLALGKGVAITPDRDEARQVVQGFMSGGTHGEAGKKVVIQEFLEGRELTAMAVTDGQVSFALPFARDHKRVYDGDRGPMTGGMGAFSPVPLPPREAPDSQRSGEPGDARSMEEVIVQDVLERTIAGLKRERIDFRGVIYAGLMLTRHGPRVLEYNVRFGDPEAQCVIPRLEGDFAGALLACATGRLRDFVEAGGLAVKPGSCISVVMASEGYPGAYRIGLPISGLNGSGSGAADDTLVFHAGTREEGGRTVTSGGRVLAVTATGASLPIASGKAYRKVRSIRFEGAHFRRDIAEDAFPGGTSA